MSTFTKEQLIARINQVTAINNYRISRDPSADGLAMDNELLAIALASLEAHGKSYGPYVPAFIGPGVWAAIVDELPSEVVGRRVWVSTSPPAPVPMKDHQIRELVNELRDIAVEYHGTQQLRERIARTVRAAMLQGADGTLTNEGTIQDGNSPVITDELIRRIAFSLVYLAADEKMRSNEDSLFALVRRGIDIVRMELSANA